MSESKHIISGHIVDVVRREIFDGSITVEGGKVTAVRKSDTSEAEVEGMPYILPPFIDSHVHIESTLLTPEHYAALAVAKGVTTVVTDPHEIANVLGVQGIDFMVESGRKVKFHFNFGVPSCVPCTPFETAGAVLDHNDIAELLGRDEFCCVAEFMNAVGVLFKDPECLAKIEAARKAGKPVDGHAPGLAGDQLKAYIAAGVSTDHECVSIEEGRERLADGMYVQIREGSASADFDTLSPLLAESEDHLMFCSDDKYPDELMEGYIDTLVNRAVRKGYPLWNVLNAACVAPVRHYSLKNGLLQEGDNADFILVDNLTDFNVLSSWVDGCEVYNQASSNPVAGLKRTEYVGDAALGKTANKFDAEKIQESDLRVSIGNGKLKVIGAKNLSIRTEAIFTSPKIECKSGVDEVVSDIENDVLKLVVYNRYCKSRPQVAFIHGFNLRKGAIATSIAHDSHNIIAVGTSDAELVAAINRLIDLRGGIVLSEAGSFTELPLPVAGLMSDLEGGSVAERHIALKAHVRELGCGFSAPFMTLAFMALPVIPDLKLTDKGLFDANKFSFTELFENQ